MSGQGAPSSGGRGLQRLSERQAIKLLQLQTAEPSQLITATSEKSAKAFLNTLAVPVQSAPVAAAGMNPKQESTVEDQQKMVDALWESPDNAAKGRDTGKRSSRRSKTKITYHEAQDDPNDDIGTDYEAPASNPSSTSQSQEDDSGSDFEDSDIKPPPKKQRKSAPAATSRAVVKAKAGSNSGCSKPARHTAGANAKRKAAPDTKVGAQRTPAQRLTSAHNIKGSLPTTPAEGHQKRSAASAINLATSLSGKASPPAVVTIAAPAVASSTPKNESKPVQAVTPPNLGSHGEKENIPESGNLPHSEQEQQAGAKKVQHNQDRGPCKTSTKEPSSGAAKSGITKSNPQTAAHSKDRSTQGALQSQSKGLKRIAGVATDVVGGGKSEGNSAAISAAGGNCKPNFGLGRLLGAGMAGNSTTLQSATGTGIRAWASSGFRVAGLRRPKGKTNGLHPLAAPNAQ